MLRYVSLGAFRLPKECSDSVAPSIRTTRYKTIIFFVFFFQRWALGAARQPRVPMLYSGRCSRTRTTRRTWMYSLAHAPKENGVVASLSAILTKMLTHDYWLFVGADDQTMRLSVPKGHPTPM